MSKKYRPAKEKELTVEKKDESPYIFQKEKLKAPVKIHYRYKDTEKLEIIKETAMDKQSKLIMIDGYWGTGKAQPLDSKLLTPTGWVKMGDIKEGDYVYSQDGEPTKVTGVFPQGEKDIFKIVFSDNSETECCEEHLWLTQTEAERNRHSRKRNGGNPIYTKIPVPPKVRTLKEIKETLFINNHLNHSIGMVSPIKFQEKKHIIHPYILGVLLGDGCLRSGVIFASEDSEIVEKVKSLIPIELVLKKVNETTRVSKASTYAITRADGGVGMYRPNLFKEELKRLGLWGKYSYEKSIPEEYLFDSVDNRTEVLRGLMDTDGTVSKNYTSFTSTSKALVNGIEFLVRSLGGTTICNEKDTFYTYKGKKLEGRLAYTVSVKLDNEINPFFLSRKVNKIINKAKYFTKRYIKSIYPVGKKEAQCIMVENSSHLYVTDDFILTHNTTVSVGVALELLNQKAVDGIIYIRNPLEATSSAKIGTLPGTLAEKMAPYNAILHDKLSEFLDKPDADRLIAESRIEFFPVGLIQGKTFSCKAIIIDEAASMSHDDLLLAVSRVGERCKVFVIGDSTFQLTLGQKSGFKRFFDAFNDEESMENGVFTFELKEEKDILRSGLLRFIMKKCGVLKTLNEDTSSEPMFPEVKKV